MPLAARPSRHRCEARCEIVAPDRLGAAACRECARRLHRPRGERGPPLRVADRARALDGCLRIRRLCRRSGRACCVLGGFSHLGLSVAMMRLVPQYRASGAFDAVARNSSRRPPARRRFGRDHRPHRRRSASLARLRQARLDLVAAAPARARLPPRLYADRRAGRHRPRPGLDARSHRAALSPAPAAAAPSCSAPHAGGVDVRRLDRHGLRRCSRRAAPPLVQTLAHRPARTRKRAARPMPDRRSRHGSRSRCRCSRSAPANSCCRTPTS